MEQRHVREISERFPGITATVSMVTAFAGQTGEIKDFAGGEPYVFLNWLQQCHVSLERCLGGIVDKIQVS
jgi:hypothetical protein